VFQPNSTTPSGTNTIRASHELYSEHQGLSRAIRNTINTTVLPSQYYGSHHPINTTTYGTSLHLHQQPQPTQRKYHNIHEIFSDIHSVDSLPINISGKYYTPMTIHTIVLDMVQDVWIYIYNTFHSLFRNLFYNSLNVYTSHYVTLLPSSIHNYCSFVCERYTIWYTSLYI
jgi:hypothetical protein